MKKSFSFKLNLIQIVGIFCLFLSPLMSAAQSYPLVEREFVGEMTEADALAILGLPANPTKQEIKTAYRILAQRHHPDLNKGKSQEQTTKKMRQINEAYNFLSRNAGIPKMKKTRQATNAALEKFITDFGLGYLAIFNPKILPTLQEYAQLLEENLEHDTFIKIYEYFRVSVKPVAEYVDSIALKTLKIHLEMNPALTEDIVISMMSSVTGTQEENKMDEILPKAIALSDLFKNKALVNYPRAVTTYLKLAPFDNADKNIASMQVFLSNNVALEDIHHHFDLLKPFFETRSDVRMHMTALLLKKSGDLTAWELNLLKEGLKTETRDHVRIWYFTLAFRHQFKLLQSDPEIFAQTVTSIRDFTHVAPEMLAISIRPFSSPERKAVFDKFMAHFARTAPEVLQKRIDILASQAYMTAVKKEYYEQFLPYQTLISSNKLLCRSIVN